MSIESVTQSEINRCKIAALPARPNAAAAFGGAGYSSAELRQAFDRLPLLVAQKFNALVAALGLVGEGSLAAALPTGLREDEPGHTLADLFADIRSGALADYLLTGQVPLSEALLAIGARLGTVESGQGGMLPVGGTAGQVLRKQSDDPYDIGWADDGSAALFGACQPKAIEDAGGYYATDTVEAALQELGATLSGLDAALAALL